jgi:hypothetical protein
VAGLPRHLIAESGSSAARCKVESRCARHTVTESHTARTTGHTPARSPDRRVKPRPLRFELPATNIVLTPTRFEWRQHLPSSRQLAPGCHQQVRSCRQQRSVDVNTRRVAVNKPGVAANTRFVAVNKLGVGVNKLDVAANKSGVAANTFLVAVNKFLLTETDWDLKAPGVRHGDRIPTLFQPIPSCWDYSKSRRDYPKCRRDYPKCRWDYPKCRWDYPMSPWAYPGFVDRLVFESGDSRLTSFELNR